MDPLSRALIDQADEDGDGATEPDAPNTGHDCVRAEDGIHERPTRRDRTGSFGRQAPGDSLDDMGRFTAAPTGAYAGPVAIIDL